MKEVNSYKDKQPVVCADPLVELLSRISKEIWGEVPEEIQTLIKKLGSDPKKRFIPPTAQEVYEYMKSKNILNPMENAQKFVDHYSVRNWVPKGYTKQMKDWKAAIRTWNLPKKINTI